MTKYYFVLLQITLITWTSASSTPYSYINLDPLQKELQCTESPDGVTVDVTCGLNSTVMIKLKNLYMGFISDLQFYCHNNNLFKISEEIKTIFESNIRQVTFFSCRFPANENVATFLKDSLSLRTLSEVVFHTESSNSSISRADLKGLDKIVQQLSINTENIATLPLDLFADARMLEHLSIYSNASTSSHLSSLIAPLENLKEMVLEINNTRDISKSIFTNKINLESLDLYWNSPTDLPPDVFSTLRSLKSIKLHGNILDGQKIQLNESRTALKQLPKGLLRDFPFLSLVEIIGVCLEPIPSDIFQGSKKITNIAIIGNILHDLPLKLFADQEELNHLNLCNNMLTTLADGLFDNNKNLLYLDLSDNQLTNLSNDLFKPLTKLYFLNIKQNKLLTIASDYNQPTFTSVFDNLINLEALILSYNSIYEIPYNLTQISKKIKTIDLSFNEISSINCNYERYFDGILNINGNPLNCDCEILCLHQHITLAHKSVMEDFGFETIRCEFPSILKGRILHQLRPSDIFCSPDSLQGNVSSECTYQIRPVDSVLVMNCSDKNFADIPTLPALNQSFSNGIELFLDNNPLTKIQPEKPKNIKNISLISIVNSSISELPKRFLSNLPKLKTVLIVLPLEKISDDVFFESTEIETLKLSGTNIERLPDLIFVNQTKLIDLDLSKNKLKIISDYGFRTNRNLETLRLSHNLLQNLSSSTFYELHQLKSLYLDNNRLHNVDLDVFLHTPSLKIVNMENNQLATTKYFDSLFGTLDELLLSKNLIGNDFSLGIQRLSPSSIDLSFNNISWIDLSDFGENLSNTFLNFTNNKITTINVTKNAFYRRDLRGIAFGNISLNCDCNIISFVEFLRENNQSTNLNNFKCLSPDSQNGHQVSDLSIEALVCSVDSICPQGCQCWNAPVNSTLIVNCSKANFFDVPHLPELETSFRNGIELSIDHNQLSSLRPLSRSGVTKLFAAHNKITNISREDFPENITFLDLSYNRIERLDEKVMNVMKASRNLKSIHLHQNPMICDCLSEKQIRYILTNKTLFPDIDQCEDGRKFHTLSYREMCSIEESNTIIVLSIIVSIVFTVLLILAVLSYKNKERILVWMYAHEICLRWITEEELDKDKEFDAFISYSSLDEDFVATELVPKLENGPKPYKLCLHGRDWVVGDFIPNQIEQSVKSSKRTIIVLTQNFLKSHWTRLEFRTAHNESVNEKRARVIVILFGDDIDIGHLDADTQKYIKMYTYLKWSDPSFWDKLSYALPHPSQKNKQSEQNDNDDDSNVLSLKSSYFKFNSYFKFK